MMPTAALPIPKPDESPWDADERAAWAPPEPITPSQWAERYRRLPRGQSARPGRWRNEAAPYLRGIMDLCDRPGIAQINIPKAAQGGVSEALRNVIAYTAHMDPEPCGLTLPSRDKGRKIVQNRLLTMFRATPVLRPFLTARRWDLQSEQIVLLNGFILHLMWSGSASSMASDPMRMAVCDEVDKYSAWTGQDSDPIALTQKRLVTYGDRALQVNISTPTTRAGAIWDLKSSSDVQLAWHVPCFHCEAWLLLNFDNVKFGGRDIKDIRQRANYIGASGDCWYECPHCAGRIDEVDRPALENAGQWRREDGDPIPDAYGEEHAHAEAVEVWPRETRVAMHLCGLHYLWIRWSTIAKEFLNATGDDLKLYAFHTETLGEPFDRAVTRTSVNFYARKSARATLAEGVVSRHAAKLLATVDTQHDHFWAVIRAWWRDENLAMRSHRVWHGRVQTFEEVETLCLRQPWPNEDDDRPPMIPELCLIDSGGTRLEGERASRTQEVYQWAFPRASRVRAIKGRTHDSRDDPGAIFWPKRMNPDRDKGGRRRKRIRYDGTFWWIRVDICADILADMMVAGVPDPRDKEPTPAAEHWGLNTRNHGVYNQHMSNSIKVPVQKGKRLVPTWIERARGARVDLWDCEVYQIAAAHMTRVPFLPPSEQLERARQAHREAAAARPRKKAKSKWKPTRLRV